MSAIEGFFPFLLLHQFLGIFFANSHVSLSKQYGFKPLSLTTMLNEMVREDILPFP